MLSQCALFLTARTHDDYPTATPLRRISPLLKTIRPSESPRECESSQSLLSAHLRPSCSPSMFSLGLSPKPNSSSDPGRRYIALLNLTWTALMLSTVPGSSFRRIWRSRARCEASQAGRVTSASPTADPLSRELISQLGTYHLSCYTDQLLTCTMASQTVSPPIALWDAGCSNRADLLLHLRAPGRLQEPLGLPGNLVWATAGDLCDVQARYVMHSSPTPYAVELTYLCSSRTSPGWLQGPHCIVQFQRHPQDRAASPNTQIRE